MQSRKRDYKQLGNLRIYLFQLLWGGGRGDGSGTAKVQERDVKYWDCMV